MTSKRGQCGVMFAALFAASPVAAELDAGHYYCKMREQAAANTPWETVLRFIPDEDTAANTVSARVCYGLMQIATDDLSRDLRDIYQYLFHPKLQLTMTRPYIQDRFTHGFITRELSDRMILHDALDDLASEALQRLANGQFDHEDLSKVLTSCWAIGRAALNQPAPEDLSPYASPEVFIQQFEDLTPPGVPSSEALAPTVDGLLARVEAGDVKPPVAVQSSRALLGETCESYTGRRATLYTDFAEDLECARFNDVVTALSFHYPAYLMDVGQDASTRARYEREYGFGQDEMGEPVQTGASCSISNGRVSERSDRHSLTCRSVLPTLAQNAEDREAEAGAAINSFRLCFASLNGSKDSVLWVDELQNKIGLALDIGENMEYTHFTLDSGAEAMRGSLLWNADASVTAARRLRTSIVYSETLPLMTFRWSIDTFAAAGTR